MRILVYGLNYAPELTGIGKYSGEMAEWLASMGHEVRVVTAPPYYPEWRIGAGYSQWRYKRESLSDVFVWRCPVWIPSRVTGLRRILHLASFVFSSLPIMLLQTFWRPSVVLTIEPPLMCAPTALMVARLSGAKAWLHVQDFEVDAAFDLGILPPGRLRGWILCAEKWLMQAFDRVSTISPRMLEKLIHKGVPQSKAMLFPNWVNTKVIFPAVSSIAFRNELGLAGNKVVALYSGNMGGKQGLEVVLDAARLAIDDARMVFVLCGDGAAKERLQLEFKELPNVTWLSLQPADRLNELLNLADIHLLPQRADVADLVMPSKLTGMLASGRPVLATARLGTQVAEVVHRCGIVTSPGNAGEMLVALRHLVENSAEREKLGHAARQYAEINLGHDAILGQFESSLLELTQQDYASAEY